MCHCECGQERAVQLGKLKSGSSRSCGCLRNELTSVRTATHGYTKKGPRPSEYRIWGCMKERCLSPNASSYTRYGGRGITVCERWLNSFESFLEDMGRRPGPEYSIERVDNEQGYSPENCVWATPQQQARNRMGTRLIKFRGEVRCVADWADALGISRSALYQRLRALNWDSEKALTQTVRSRPRLIEFGGETMCLQDWASRTGIGLSTLSYRLNAGWPVERALTELVR